MIFSTVPWNYPGLSNKGTTTSPFTIVFYEVGSSRSFGIHCHLYQILRYYTSPHQMPPPLSSTLSSSLLSSPLATTPFSRAHAFCTPLLQPNLHLTPLPCSHGLRMAVCRYRHCLRPVASVRSVLGVVSWAVGRFGAGCRILLAFQIR